MDDKPRMVSAFEHENALMHYGRVNKRSLIALIAVCVTFVVITLIFVIGYTIREKNWLDTLANLKTPVVEVNGGGVYQQPDS